MAETNFSISGVQFDSFIVNASGPKDVTFEELEVIGKSGSAGILTKSCTLEYREGNPEPRYVDLPHGSMQSMGLPNLGYKAYVEMMPELKKFNKPVISSISGLCEANNLEMIKAFQDSDVDLLELNLSCPNIVGKPQTGYDFEQSDQLLENVQKINKKPLGLKLPPYFDRVHQKQMAELVLKHKIDFITCINSVGNTLVIDAEKETPLIKPKGGFGGLCGEQIKPIALANVRAFYELLEGKVPIFGVGGVTTGKDAFEFLLAGATGIQVATVFWQEGPGCFERINNELSEFLEKKGYKSADEARGKLKPM